jgi:replicative DNA helicase
MPKINKDTLGFLGLEYQRRLANQLLTDNRFAESILDIIVPSHFDDPILRVFTAEMKEAFDEDEVVLDIESLKIRLASKTNDEITQQKNLANLKMIQEIECKDVYHIQDTAMKFFKQQNLKRAMDQINFIIEKGNLDDYAHCEALIKEALEAGDNKDDSVDVTDNIEEVIKEDYRDPIPTGIPGLDPIMNGGLAKGELGIILAALGVGKTTLITKMASHAKDCGYNVVQIFFEDLPKQIQRKHLACWTGINISELSEPQHRDYIIKTNEEKKSSGGTLKLKRMAGDSTTIPKIKKYLKGLISKGFKPDIILLDYIDKVQPSRRFDDNNIAEGAVMSEFESMLYELDVAGWTAIQGNRSSINTEFVETDQMGGSIKKAQIGHFIMSAAKSLEQRDNKTANMAILKSRFGSDGITFEDVIFDNGTINIDLTQSGGKTFLETKEYKEKDSQNKLNDLLNDYNAKKKGSVNPEDDDLDKVI